MLTTTTSRGLVDSAASLDASEQIDVETNEATATETATSRREQGTNDMGRDLRAGGKSIL
ncbi:MAG: hypothetical protein QM775_03685 [Pirellulales bacterium]